MKLLPSIYYILKFIFVILTFITLYFLSQHVHRGFICGDSSLSLTPRPDTISNALLVFWGFSPFLILFVWEFSSIYANSRTIKFSLKQSWKIVAFLCHRFFADMLLMHLVVVAAKFFTRSHRPHFFETCKPDKMYNCTLGTFVDSFECTNTEVGKIRKIDASMSFFSGHAATCVYSCFFIIWYIQRKLQSSSIVIIPFIQTLLICLAFYGSISRVFDHRHHWWDVLAGGIVGLITSYHACYVLCDNSLPRKEVRKDIKDNNQTFLPTINV
ncbi:CLUMA_CG012993, isoform A [Clunio marinus]|uniref:CLUMA_CG012993, isoform A n=1 Tax=Clunio marinus TaxID=568069 RepID=A0A1J1IHI6_9DIPT|nr:CLUMA_CG012993, isoform A [Clunio marinus]